MNGFDDFAETIAGWLTNSNLRDASTSKKVFQCFFSYQDWVFACVHKPLQSGDAGDNIIFIDKQIL